MRHRGDLWETPGRHPGDTWGSPESGRHQGDTWETPGTRETPGRHQGDTWETPGRHLGLTWDHMGDTWEQKTPGSKRHLGDTGEQGGRSWQAFGKRKNAFNSFVGRVFANSRQKTLFFCVLPKLQQKGSFYLVLPSFYLVLPSFY